MKTLYSILILIFVTSFLYSQEKDSIELYYNENSNQISAFSEGKKIDILKVKEFSEAFYQFYKQISTYQEPLIVVNGKVLYNTKLSDLNVDLEIESIKFHKTKYSYERMCNPYLSGALEITTKNTMQNLTTNFVNNNECKLIIRCPATINDKNTPLYIY